MRKRLILIVALCILFSCGKHGPSGKTDIIPVKPGETVIKQVKHVKEITSELLTNLDCITDIGTKYSFDYNEESRVTKITAEYWGETSTSAYSVLNYDEPGTVVCKYYINSEQYGPDYMWSSLLCRLNEDNLIDEAVLDWKQQTFMWEKWDYSFSYYKGNIASMRKDLMDDTVEPHPFQRFEFEKINGGLKWKEWFSGEPSSSEGVISFKYRYARPLINLEWSLLSLYSSSFFPNHGLGGSMLALAPFFLGYSGTLCDYMAENQVLFTQQPSSTTVTKIDANTDHVQVKYLSGGITGMRVEYDDDGCPEKLFFETTGVEEWCREYDVVQGNISGDTVQNYLLNDDSGFVTRIIYFSYL
ncbi:MAG: hypothetical protein J5769_06530 [Bacteroidales bacterium]|nr:hypothetical protein [Bacteroidales bacterium]